MKIAVDAMGGDNAPQAIVEGVMLAKKEFSDIEFLLYGKEAEIRKYIWYTETNGLEYTENEQEKYYLGSHNDAAYYFSSFIVS